MSSTMRWLSPAVVFISLQWSLLLKPATILPSIPALWSTAPVNASLALKLPRTRVEAFELGWHAAHRAMCVGERNLETCTVYLDTASATLGAAVQLTSAQLDKSALQAALLLEDEERSVTQRILGFISFVNLVWLVSVFGVLATLIPFVLYIFGEAIAELLTKLYKDLIVPMHKHGIFELVAYAISFLFSAQSCRYPVQHASAATLVGLTGGLGFLPCWSYSTALWTEKTCGKEEEFTALTGTLLALSLAPLALVHGSSLLGFCTVTATYVACGFVMGPLFGGFYIGFRSLGAVWRCLLVSAAFIVVFAALHVIHARGPFAPFALGARVLGNFGYFLALLIASSEWHRGVLSYGASNGLMLASIVAAALVGNVFALPSYTNTASTFFVLWIMEKELEAKWGPGGIAVLFVNFVALYLLAHHLHTHPEIITSLFDQSA